MGLSNHEQVQHFVVPKRTIKVNIKFGKKRVGVGGVEWGEKKYNTHHRVDYTKLEKKDEDRQKERERKEERID